MDIIINLIAALIFLSISLGSVFCSYFFWRSENGQLRKIMISKYATMAVVWLTFGLLVYFSKPSWVVGIAAMICLPYLHQKIRLVRYLIANKK